ncbi:SDR family oxidoreductase [Pseudokineococcus marinus]|uniref:SDR family oxidoreductase n=1 Tax=Pseudokineococcus marinus TaxID=351215 RepID=A0A849BQW6_9ACTN|nr:SDR family oxidoreductase [Pseudokineococcus marinus]NNH22904.1 SDR family oxidoreductase [Pseudokineococcus marinus]
MTGRGPIATTGATGAVGGRVARRLADAGAEQVLVVRDPSRAPELPRATVARAAYDDARAVRAALEGVPVALLVSASEHPRRVDLHRTFVDAAVAAGVEHVVYLSFLGAAPDATFTFARDHWATEEHLRASGLRWTALRDSTYADFFPLMVGEDGALRGPAGDGRVAPVAQDDVADALTAVLLDPGAHVGRTYDLTGPEALSYAQIAAELTEALGRPVRYEQETVDEAYASRAPYGVERWEVDGWVSTYTAVARGEMDVVSGDVERLTGHRPRSLAEVLRARRP